MSRRKFSFLSSRPAHIELLEARSVTALFAVEVARALLQKAGSSSNKYGVTTASEFCMAELQSNLNDSGINFSVAA